MKIPKTFKLYGLKYTVKIADAEMMAVFGRIGLANPAQGAITISDGIEKTLQEQAFYHELVHAILDAMGHELYDDEVFVQTFSALLHQAVATGE